MLLATHSPSSPTPGRLRLARPVPRNLVPRIWPHVWRLRSTSPPSSPEPQSPEPHFRTARLLCVVDQAPIDFLSDPDGPCEYELLARAAGFDPEGERVSIGALLSAFEGFPEGAAVVAEKTEGLTRVVLLEPKPAPQDAASNAARTDTRESAAKWAPQRGLAPLL